MFMDIEECWGKSHKNYAKNINANTLLISPKEYLTKSGHQNPKLVIGFSVFAISCLTELHQFEPKEALL